MKGRPIVTALILAGGTILIVLPMIWRQKPRRAAGPLSHDVYVWQRTWHDGVSDAVQQAASQVARFIVLAAEVSWDDAGKERTCIRVKPDYRGLSASEKPVGLALRIGPFPGRIDGRDETTQGLIALSKSILAEAREAGCDPVELQIDFDCPEARLKEFREWVVSIRKAIAPTSLTLTALPCWLKRKEFADLVRECAGFVLQVHSLEMPTGPSEPFALCDPERSLEWVETASRTGVRFQVALPTYGYELCFDGDGRLAAIAAEGDLPMESPGTQVRAVRSNAEAMADLCQRWIQDRPACMTGIIWFRLPVAGDRLNWKWQTLSAIMSGKRPEPAPRVEVIREEPELAEIVLVNVGESDVVDLPDVTVTWQGAPLIAADGLRSYRIEASDDSHATIRWQDEEGREVLAPGDRWKVAWLRFSEATEVKACVQVVP